MAPQDASYRASDPFTRKTNGSVHGMLNGDDDVSDVEPRVVDVEESENETESPRMRTRTSSPRKRRRKMKRRTMLNLNDGFRYVNLGPTFPNVRAMDLVSESFCSVTWTKLITQA